MRHWRNAELLDDLSFDFVDGFDMAELRLVAFADYVNEELEKVLAYGQKVFGLFKLGWQLACRLQVEF